MSCKPRYSIQGTVNPPYKAGQCCHTQPMGQRLNDRFLVLQRCDWWSLPACHTAQHKWPHCTATCGGEMTHTPLACSSYLQHSNREMRRRRERERERLRISLAVEPVVNFLPSPFSSVTEPMKTPLLLNVVTPLQHSNKSIIEKT